MGCSMVVMILVLWMQTRVLLVNKFERGAPSQEQVQQQQAKAQPPPRKMQPPPQQVRQQKEEPPPQVKQHKQEEPQVIKTSEPKKVEPKPLEPPPPEEKKPKVIESKTCPITSISQLSDAELHPKAGDRHMVTPPDGGKVSLLCCQTTKGNMNILVHKKWAPNGAERFLKMVASGYFSSQIPLFRCTDACQFGLAGDPELTKQYNNNLKDDPPWLPTGPDHRENDKGVKRYPPGFLTYAGGGPDTRSNQFVLTLKPNQFMGGGSPWEVPMGELVGKASFDTMAKFYTGYGEKGPTQGILHKEGFSESIRELFPLMDSITGCDLVEERIL